MAPLFLRVESKANVADGPTRNNFEYLNLLRAEFVEPKLIPWTYNVCLVPPCLRDGIRLSEASGL